MQLSSFTMQVLKNFASINSNIVIKPGNELVTMAEAKNILAKAKVSETFEQQFGIYDLPEFLSVLNLVSDPQLYFKDSYVDVRAGSGRGSVKYFFSDVDMLTTPSKGITMPEVNVKFDLDEGTLNNLKRAAAALGHSAVSITASDNVIKLTVVDSENATSNSYSIEVDGEYDTEDFNFIVNINNLRMIPADYKVEISSKLISQFTSMNKEMDLTYWVAFEKSSTYNA